MYTIGKYSNECPHMIRIPVKQFVYVFFPDTYLCCYEQNLKRA